jgi:outer membrane protein TolC
VKENEAAVEAARADLADAQNRTRAEVRELMARAGKAERLCILIGEGLIPQARATLESALTSYGVGRLQFLDLLGDVKTLLEARISLAGEEADRFQALAALEPLVGREMIEVDRAQPGGGGQHESTR